MTQISKKIKSKQIRKRKGNCGEEQVKVDEKRDGNFPRLGNVHLGIKQ